jgi:hypothetical protein
MVVGADSAPFGDFTEIPSAIGHWDLAVPAIIREQIRE